MEQINLKQIAEKYNLPEHIAAQEIENSISETLSCKYNADIEAVLKGEKLNLTKYTNFDIFIIKNKLTRKTEKELLENIEYSLIKKTVFLEYENIKNQIGSVKTGTIIRANGSLDVEIKSADIYTNIIGICNMRAQTPKERGKYRIGDRLSFHIQNIVPVNSNDVSRLQVTLSRNSKSLVEGLFKKHLAQKGKQLKVKCRKRIAGVFSEMEALEYVPKEIIKKVSSELREQVIVKFR